MRGKMDRYGVVRRLYFVLPACLLAWATIAGAHIAHVPVVVDTDMALDDIRAISMLVNAEFADIWLCVTSDGAVSPETGAANARRLFHILGKDDIPVAAGRTLGKPDPAWRTFNEAPAWPEGKEISIRSVLPAARAIIERLSKEVEPVVYLCLGPLTNLADAMAADPTLQERISKVVYYGTPPDAPAPGWNTERDPDAARAVFSSGVSITAIRIPDERLPVVDDMLIAGIVREQRPAAILVASLQRPAAIGARSKAGHFRTWDETVVVYLARPSVFQTAAGGPEGNILVSNDFSADSFRETYVRLFSHPEDFHLSPRRGVLFTAFPRDPALFRPDVAGRVEEIIARYGSEEWKACLLTNELHRHLGIYSLVGAKMGVRAREILEAPFDSLTVVSMAGSGPPLSCLNDGLQASTGASLGRGTISVAEDRPAPAAAFTYQGKTLLLRLKPAVLDRIRTDIRAAVERFGGLCPEYFAHVRKLALEYWLELDRKKIFEQEEMKTTNIKASG